jgi:hypothetical protein
VNITPPPLADQASFAHGAFLAPAPRVDLRSIIDEPSGRYAIIEVDGGQRMLRVAAEELATFDAFRRRVRAALNFDIGPPRLEWAAAVRGAEKRGAA